MSYLVFLIIFTIVLILIAWLYSKYLSYYNSNKVLSLESDDDELLTDWYKSNIKPIYTVELNNTIIAAKYISQIYNIDIDPSLLVVGQNLSDKFINIISSNNFNTKDQKLFMSSNINDISSIIKDNNILFDIRSSLGINCDIAIIHNSNLRNKLQKDSLYDLYTLDSILETNHALAVHKYLSNELNARWDVISSINLPNILNNNGSFVYLKVDPNFYSDKYYNTVITIFDNIQATMTPKGARINLLCSHNNFKLLMTRLSQYNIPLMV